MNSHNQRIIEKIKSKESLIAIIGLGYVGLPLLLRFAEMEFRVLGIDVDDEKINQLNNTQSYIAHISPERIRKCNRFIKASNDFSEVLEADAVILCVPTPLNKYREPDLSFVINTTKSILPYLRSGQVISLESTTYPGTTEEVIKPLIESGGFTIGENIFLVYSPEREDPGNPDFSTATITKICGGVTNKCLAVGLALYREVIHNVVPVSSTKTAEMTKLLENIHRAVNIGLVNEMKIVADKMDVDIYEVINAAATKPFGFVPYYPGPGLGGHCIPIDPFYLTWKAREYGLHTRFIELAGEINNSMPKWVTSKLADALNDRTKTIKNSLILIMGIAYKKNVGDTRESPAVAIMEILVAKGAQVEYYDPYVTVFPKMREHHFELSSIKLSSENLQKYDAVIIATAHDKVDYELIKQHAKLIIDTRGVYQDSFEHIIKA